MIFVFVALKILQPFAKVGLYLAIALMVDLGLGLGITDAIITMLINWVKSQIGFSDVLGGYL